MLPHLLVVGVVNSDDQGPTRPCMRLSGEHGGGGGPVGGEIEPPPPSHVSSTPPGMRGLYYDKLKELEDEVCCPIYSEESLPNW